MVVMSDKEIGELWREHYDMMRPVDVTIRMLIRKLVEEATECEMRALQNAHMTRAQCRRRVLDNYGIPKETWR